MRRGRDRQRGDSYGRSGGAVPAPIYGLSGFSAASQLAGPAAGALRGSLSGHWIAVLHRVDSLAGGANKELVRNTDPGDVAGYRFSFESTTVLKYVCQMTGPVTVVSPTYSLVAGDVGKLMLSWGVWDQVAGKIRLYPKNAIEQGTGTVTALAQLPAGLTNNMTIGRYNVSGANYADANTILAVMGGDGFIPTAAEILAADAALKATGVLTAVPGKTTHRWPTPANWVASGVLADSIGSDNLTLLSGTSADLTLNLCSQVWA